MLICLVYAWNTVFIVTFVSISTSNTTYLLFCYQLHFKLFSLKTVRQQEVGQLLKAHRNGKAFEVSLDVYVLVILSQIFCSELDTISWAVFNTVPFKVQMIWRIVIYQHKGKVKAFMSGSTSKKGTWWWHQGLDPSTSSQYFSGTENRKTKHSTQILMAGIGGKWKSEHHQLFRGTRIKVACSC